MKALLANVFALFFLTSSCGKSSSDKNYSGSLQSCHVKVVGDDSQMHCTDFSYSGKMKSDPRSDASTEAKRMCDDFSSTATFTTGSFEDKACAFGVELGHCEISKSVQKDGQTATLTGKMTFAGSAMSATVAQQYCTDAGGTYTAP